MAVFSSNTNVFHGYTTTNSFPHLPLTSTFHLHLTTSTKQLKSVVSLKAVPAPTPTAAHPIIATDDSWTEFCNNISGEWDGFGADFTPQGEPIQLPESVVPEAYREWDVKVFDWQTQCPTLSQLLHHDNDDNLSPSFMYKSIKLLPTVGCGADAATTYTIQERHITTTTPTPFAYQSTGCYVALWTNTDTMELEHCLVDPRDKESRVRVIQVLESSSLKLRSIKVFVEQWYGPFRNGDQLGGCAVRDSAFAATQPLKPSQVSGVWQALNVAADFSNSHHHHMIRPLRTWDGYEHKSIRDRDGDDLILLPKQLWCSVKKSAEDMEAHCEVGWLLAPGHAITSTCNFSTTAHLKEITVATETAVPAL